MTGLGRAVVMSLDVISRTGSGTVQEQRSFYCSANFDSNITLTGGGVKYMWSGGECVRDLSDLSFDFLKYL